MYIRVGNKVNSIVLMNTLLSKQKQRDKENSSCHWWYDDVQNHNRNHKKFWFSMHIYFASWPEIMALDNIKLILRFIIINIHNTYSISLLESRSISSSSISGSMQTQQQPEDRDVPCALSWSGSCFTDLQDRKWSSWIHNDVEHFAPFPSVWLMEREGPEIDFLLLFRSCPQVQTAWINYTCTKLEPPNTCPQLTYNLLKYILYYPGKKKNLKKKESLTLSYRCVYVLCKKNPVQCSKHQL